MQEARSLIRTHLGDPQSSWGIGTLGAIAEFHRDADESCHTDDLETLTYVTPRGGLQIDLHPGTEIVAYESLSAYRQRWVHGLVFCLPRASGTGSQRTRLTELGPDDGALLAHDRTSVLFDVGVGAPHLDACIRTGDPDLLALLRRHEGEQVVQAGHEVLRAIIEASPHRVFFSRLGRAEVFQGIATDASPEGPHTHLFPKILRAGRTHASGIALGNDALPCLWLFPPNPSSMIEASKSPSIPSNPPCSSRCSNAMARRISYRSSRWLKTHCHPTARRTLFRRRATGRSGQRCASHYGSSRPSTAPAR